MIERGFQPIDPVSPNPVTFNVAGLCSGCGCGCSCYCGDQDSSATSNANTNWQAQSSVQTVAIARSMFGGCS